MVCLGAYHGVCWVCDKTGVYQDIRQPTLQCTHQRGVYACTRTRSAYTLTQSSARDICGDIANRHDKETSQISRAKETLMKWGACLVSIPGSGRIAAPSEKYNTWIPLPPSRFGAVFGNQHNDDTTTDSWKNMTLSFLTNQDPNQNQNFSQYLPVFPWIQVVIFSVYRSFWFSDGNFFGDFIFSSIVGKV